MSLTHSQTIDAALSAYAQGNFASATTLAKQAVKARTDDAESWSILGLCLAKDNTQADAARSALTKATEMEPAEPRWWMHLGLSLLDEMNDATGAEAAFRIATERAAGNPQVMTKWGDALLACGRASDAAQVYGRVLQSSQSPALWMKAGDALTAARDTVNAVYAYEKAYNDADRPDAMTGAIADMHINLGNYGRAAVFNNRLRDKNPHDPDAGLRAANLLRWQGDLEGAKALQSTLWSAQKMHPRLTAAMVEDGAEVALTSAETMVKDGAGLAPDDRRRLAFALTHYYDKAGDGDRAWDYGTLANSLYTDGNDAPQKSLTSMAEMLEAALLAYSALPDLAAQDGLPKMVYIIGPPRSGGSLLQTILARVPGAKSVGERGALLSWLPQLLDTPDKLADILVQLRASDAAGMAKAAGAADIFIDKTTHHVLIAGILSKVHPGAVFVAPWRSRADMAVSLYFHEFGPEFAFARNLDDIKTFLDFHEAAVERWREVGVDIAAHDHDEFVSDPAVHGPSLCAKLNLPWADDMLRAREDDGTVRTFSARQVRGGISTKFQGRGARYSAKLGGRFTD